MYLRMSHRLPNQSRLSQFMKSQSQLLLPQLRLPSQPMRKVHTDQPLPLLITKPRTSNSGVLKTLETKSLRNSGRKNLKLLKRRKLQQMNQRLKLGRTDRREFTSSTRESTSNTEMRRSPTEREEAWVEEEEEVEVVNLRETTDLKELREVEEEEVEEAEVAEVVEVEEDSKTVQDQRERPP